MKKVLNWLFYGLKFILLLAAAFLTLFILIRMNIRLQKSITSILPLFIPFLLVLILFIVNMLFKQKGVTDNIFYNITCCLVFTTMIVVGIRAMFDTNMVLNQKYGYGIDFNFFDNFISYMKIMLYGLSITNLFFMFTKREVTNKNLEQEA